MKLPFQANPSNRAWRDSGSWLESITAQWQCCHLPWCSFASATSINLPFHGCFTAISQVVKEAPGAPRGRQATGKGHWSKGSTSEQRTSIIHAGPSVVRGHPSCKLQLIHLKGMCIYIYICVCVIMYIIYYYILYYLSYIWINICDIKIYSNIYNYIYMYGNWS